MTTTKNNNNHHQEKKTDHGLLGWLHFFGEDQERQACGCACICMYHTACHCCTLYPMPYAVRCTVDRWMPARIYSTVRYVRYQIMLFLTMTMHAYITIITTRVSLTALGREGWQFRCQTGRTRRTDLCQTESAGRAVAVAVMVTVIATYVTVIAACHCQ